MMAGASINYRRFAVAVLAAGVLLNSVTAIGNSTVFKSGFDLWAAGMTAHLAPPRPPLQITLWTLMCLIDALIGVWIYIALRPRFGAGSQTALLAGLAVWVVGRFCVALDMLGLGVFPVHMMIEQGLLGLLAILPSTLLGAWIYKD
jgi:hypothetical protein